MNVDDIRMDFPFFQPPGPPCIYLDNGATTQKPQPVLERISEYYRSENANIHRGDYRLSQDATRNFEQTRETVRRWIDAGEAEEIIFTKSSTEAINLAASGVFACMDCPGGNVVTTELEHSSNFFPWKYQCEKNHMEFRTARADPSGNLTSGRVLEQIDSNTRLVAVTAMSNVTGERPDLAAIIGKAHSVGALVLVDASQEIAHHRIFVRRLDCDFLAFSGHKMYAPMGVGVLYGKKRILEQLPPLLYGGGMMETDAAGNYTCKQGPERFEAGTQNVGAVLGLEAAIQYLNRHDFDALCAYESALARKLRKALERIGGIHCVGSETASPVCSFHADQWGAYDIGVLLSSRGIAIRTGAHCAYPLLKRVNLPSLCRISLSFYNTEQEVEAVAQALEDILGRRR